MAVAAAGDLAQALAWSAGGFGRDQAQIGHELSWVGKAMDIAQLADRDHRGDELEAAEGHQRLHGRLEVP